MRLNIIGIILFVFNFQVYSQISTVALWSPVKESTIPKQGVRIIEPTAYLTYKLDINKAHELLDSVTSLADPAYVPRFFQIPHPDGTLHEYQVYLNETMSPGLMDQFPGIRSYDGVATNSSGEVVKLDLTPQGFHAMILVPGASTIFIDPYQHGIEHPIHYIVYSTAHFQTNKLFSCDYVPIAGQLIPEPESLLTSPGNGTKRTYRLALAATGEYTVFHGGTVALAQAAQVTTINRVNGVYMRDLAVTLTIIPNNSLLIYTNASTDPYTNGNASTMSSQNQTNVTAVIGNANYDIGHVFGTNSGGVAHLGVVCDSTYKARGVTGSSSPVGDPFDVDYVCHEVGHQFSGNHTFRASTGSCSGNANSSTAMEPGSGTTIMAYAGICSPQNVQSLSDDYFHAASLQEMHAYITSGDGGPCAVATSIPNQSAPVITSVVSNVTIPTNTPFALTALATDPDGDILTYCWEQMDNGNSTQPPVSASTTGPNFRSLEPSLSGTRYFPNIASILSGGPFTWEVLPSAARTMNFKCVVRDNNAGGGCNDTASVAITTAPTTAGVYQVTYPTASGISWYGNSTQTITWDVAGTDLSPFSCSNVDILLSTDSGATFTNIANNVPNDGSETITLPNTPSTSAVIMVQCANGTFFDISNNLFTILPATNDYTLSLEQDSLLVCQGSNAVYSLIVGQLGTYMSPVTLSATGLPSGMTVAFGTNPITPGDTTTVTLSGTSSISSGVYTFTINGNSASGPHLTQGKLTLASTTPSTSTAASPINGAASVALNPTLSWTNLGAGLLHTVRISTDTSMSTVVDSAVNLSGTSYLATGLLPSTTYYWQIASYNSCSSSALSPIYSFTTSSCGTFLSTNVPVVIPSSGTPTVTSTLTIQTPGIIDDLDVVDLIGTHSYISDLTVKLTSPAGTQVTLWSSICGSQENFDVNFDDEATSATLPCPPTGGGTYIPNQSLSAFDGENMVGVWTLTIIDGYNQDGGSLTSWGLEICTTPNTPNVLYVDPANGNNSNTGSYSSPLKSIPTALNLAAQNSISTVYVKSGTYNFTSSIKISTASSTKITLSPEPNGYVKFNLGSFRNFRFYQGANNIEVKGFEFDGNSNSLDHWTLLSEYVWQPASLPNSLAGGGIAIQIEDAQNIQISDNYIHDFYQKAVNIEDGRYVTVQGNIIHRIAQTSLSGGHGIMRGGVF